MNREESKRWLLENGWNEHPDIDDYLTRNPLELIVIREDGVWYWEDSRANGAVYFKPYPTTIRELIDLSGLEPAAPAQIDWIPGPPDQSGDYLISSKHWPHPSWEAYEPDSVRWDSDEVLFHVGPIPKTPDRV